MKLNRKFLLTFFISFIVFCFGNYVFAETPEPEITSPAAVLVDNYTGSVLFEKNIDQKMYPASTTKILTAILAIENCDLNEMATASEDAIMTVPSGYSIGDIKVGESLTVKNLLEVLMVHSANDAANVLGEHVGGSIDGFADMMNEKAKEIGCQNTHFVNPSGKHDDNHYSTARDMAMIMIYCMKNPTFRELSSLRSCSLPATSFSAQRDFTTTVEILIPSTATNKNIYYYPYAIAGKTGFTTEAQNCLVSVSKKDNMELTSVILGSGKTADGHSARFLETIDIYNYGFDNFKIDKVCNSNNVVKSIEISNGTPETKNLPLIIKDDVSALAKVSDDLSSVEPNITLMQDLKAPIIEGQVVGKATYTVRGVDYTTDILASHSVEESMVSDVIIIVGIVLAIILLLIIIILLIKSTHKKEPTAI